MCRLSIVSILLILTLLGDGLRPTGDQAGFFPETYSIRLALAGYIPPSMTSIAVEGAIAYVGAGPALAVIDISDSQNPRQISAILLPRAAEKVVASQGKVYILTDEDHFDPRDNHVLILDVSNPLNPRMVGEYGPLAIADLAAEGRYLYLGGGDGLSIVDVYNPLYPRILSNLAVPESQSITAIDLSGNYVVAGVREGYRKYSLWVIDVSDEEQPNKTGELAESDKIYMDELTDLVISGPLAAVAETAWSTMNSSYFTLFELTDPAHPARLGSAMIQTGISPSVAVLGERLYAATQNDPIQVYDISDPWSPVRLGEGEDPVWDLAAANQQVYVASGASGMAIYGGQAGDALQKQGDIQGIGSAEDVNSQSGVLYIADGGARSYAYDYMYGGLAVADATQPGSVDVVGKTIRDVYLIGAGRYIAHENERVYLIAGACFLRYTSCGQALYVLDAVLPETPTLLGSIAFELYGSDNSIFAGPVSVQNQVAYLPNHSTMISENGLAVIDATQPTTPTLINLYRPPSPDGANSLHVDSAAITAHYALLTASADFGLVITSTLQVVDISNPIAIVPRASYPMTWARQVFIQGSKAFVVDDDFQLNQKVIKIFDLANLPTLDFIASLPGFEVVNDVAYDGRYAYVAAGKDGVRVLDMADPANPREIYAVDTAGEARALALDGEWIVLADGTGGLLIFQPIAPRLFLPRLSK